MNAKEIIFTIILLVLLPIITFVALRRSRMVVRILFAAVIFLLGTVVLPNVMRTRAHVSENACVNNLRWIQEAKRRWAEVNHKNPTDVPTMADLFNEKADLEFRKGTNYPPGVFKIAPTCPAGGTYIVGAMNEEPKCSIGPPQHTLHPQAVVYQ